LPAGAPTLPLLPTLPLCQLYFSLNAYQWLVFTRRMIDFIEKVQLAKWQSGKSGKVGKVVGNSKQVRYDAPRMDNAKLGNC